MTVLSTESQLPDEFAPIAQRLEAAGTRFRLAAVVGALGRFLAITVPAATATLFVTGFFDLPRAATFALYGLAAATVILAYVLALHHALWHRPTYGEIARWIEQGGGAGLGLTNELINAVLLAQEYQASGAKIARREIPARHSPWIPQVLTEIARTTAGKDFTRAVPWTRHRRNWYWALGMIVIALTLIAATPGTFARAFAVMQRPGQFVPRVGKVKIVSVQPGNDTVLIGQSVTFLATVELPDDKVVPAHVEITAADGSRSTHPMTLWQGNNQYKYQLPTPLTSGIKYVVTVGDTQSERYELNVRAKVTLLQYALEIEPPPYTGHARRTVSLAGNDLTPVKGSVTVPEGTAVTITATFDIPVHEAILDTGTGTPTLMSSSDNRTFTVRLMPERSLPFALQANDKQTRPLKRFPESSADVMAAEGSGDMFMIAVTPDTTPRPVLAIPSSNTIARPGDTLAIEGNARDDYGVTRIVLEMAVGADEKRFTPVQTWPVPADSTGPEKPTSVRHALNFPADKFRFGDTVRLRLTAYDNRDLTAVRPDLGNQAGESDVRTVTFTDTAAAAAQSSKLWEDLQKRLKVLLDDQTALYKLAHKLPGGRDAPGGSHLAVKPATIPATSPATPPALAIAPEALPQLKKSTADIAAGQRQLRTDMRQLAQNLLAPDAARKDMALATAAAQLVKDEIDAGRTPKAADVAAIEALARKVSGASTGNTLPTVVDVLAKPTASARQAADGFRLAAAALSRGDRARAATEITEASKALKRAEDEIGRFVLSTPQRATARTLETLATDDASLAVDRAADIALITDPRTFTPLATKVRTHQARVIDVLQALLGIAESKPGKPSEIADKEGGDVPNEARKAWEKFKDELEAFKKEQKQVIDSTADLAKKPKDDFNKEDEKKFKELAAIEDKWEKFLSNRLADMSKVAEQDQANVALLEEMVQMKVELAMAKNALENKAAEIATALEDNGLENAKALTTHIERWLMHQPDRTQWKMEEPVNQNDPKMAELPKQLQDMVSDLMDQEEDVTEEMENLGSKWADSLDKGAGWDAAEGPISNMSAQGVTGNQMPKDTEIQGRSGEGREGRSSGEFVGAEAEGKGGRKTPTRMTPEPFSSGKVDDKSQDPAGGATGGGKKGGFGGEGLEGPGPQEIQATLQRLQGKQAAIRNQSERLELQMKAANFNNFKLFEANVLMKKAEEALRNYHYNTALFYQREAVKSLNTAKVLANGQVNVTADASSGLSPRTQKEIKNAMDAVMPKGYADPVKAYFEKISQDAGKE